MHTRTLALACALTSLSQLSTAAQPAPPAPPCDAAAGYICNQQGPEDLVPLGSEWAATSAMAGSGGIALIRLRDRRSISVYPAATAREQHDAKAYPGCPGPPRGDFTTHGVYAAPGNGPVHRLFVVGHGTRESIEVFQIDTRGTSPVATWIGCAVAPDPIGLNSVRGLPDGGFITTNFLPRGQAAQSMLGGAKNGELWEWHAATGWQKVPGSEASGANGVELSEDGRTLYIAAWGSQSLIRLARGATGTPAREEVPLGFRIDNIHWARDGSLLGAGQAGQEWKVVKIDPKTLAVKTVHQQKDDAAFSAGTAALEVGDALWVGSFRGDRIVIVKPAK